MTETAPVVPPIVDLDYVERLATALAAGEVAEINLGDLVHDRATHADLVPASVLAWWLLSTLSERARLS